MRVHALTPWRRLIGALLLTTIFWLVLSWPLPRHLTHAIPHASHSDEIRQMVPGDHLQLMYHYWLLADMLAGHTPWFHNVYEFNTGDDGARRSVGAYYLPFSLIFAAGNAIGGRAFGWNLSGFVSLWMTAWLMWVLARRWGDSDWIGATAATMALTLPFGWAMLLGGSPTGPAMMWPALVALGIDIAVCERRTRGGLFAGIGLLGAYATDTHVFFFVTLFSPVFALLSLARTAHFPWRQPRAWGQVVLAMLPAAIFFLVSLILNTLDTRSDVLHSRSFQEIAFFSPQWRDFFIYRHEGIATHVYLGLAPPALVLSGVLAFWLGRRGPCKHTLWTYGLSVLAIAALLLLALGPNSPAEALCFRAARRLIPPYQMIRQPAKIMCILPVLFALPMALACAAWRLPLQRVGRGCLMALCVWMTIQTRSHMQVGLSGIDTTQAAYAAVAADAAEAGEKPHVLVLPFWNGHSHFSSVYDHYVSLYRIRMVNGYRPFVPQAYIDNVHARFEPLNAGIVTDELLDELLAMGIRHLIVHEDLFPEPVSPFPVMQTLARLREHPRVELRVQSGSVWAFRLHASPQAPLEPGRVQDCAIQGVARRWELENLCTDTSQIVVAADASAGTALALDATTSMQPLPALRVPAVPGLQWRVRARGHGAFSLETRAGGHPLAEAPVTLDTHTWTWVDAEIPAARDLLDPIQLSFIPREGTIELDLALLAAGDWAPAREGEAQTIAAACFFHAGHVTPGTDHVQLDPERAPRGAVFYGLKLPLPTGRAAVRLVASSPAAPGTLLGRFSVRWADHEFLAETDVIAGTDTRLEWNQTHNLPVNVVFVYDATAPLVLEQVILERLGTLP